ncbi:inovirus Gp2 family protein [Providencia alcalifaciens]|uniref:inovirus Gp2 family protein n=1 Tax=Providencia alcalifaciens TaxID=126385 RepID=UPI0012B6572A|nr:inovirus Gp2 family protein [Providencia alcalifaciens]MTC17296.1 inovirus Gp2 family protein [Providencia alcalifaciens]
MIPLYELTKTELNNLILEASNKYGSEIDGTILCKSLAVVYESLKKHNRIFATRTDLRFAQDHVQDEPDLPLCFQRVDEKAITRFIESLKSQLRADHKRSGRAGEPTLPAYIWAKERKESEHYHYHLVLLFNADVYNYLGNYLQDDANNMATRIQRAWCSAIGLGYPDYASLVNFSENPVYRFDRRDAHVRNSNYFDFLLRITYLAKMNTKELNTDFRNFGASQV